MAHLAVATFGRLDTWAHVAGVAEHARFEDIAVEELRRVVEVDLLGPVWGAGAALPYLRAAGAPTWSCRPRSPSARSRWHRRTGRPSTGWTGSWKEAAGVSVTQVVPAAVATPFLEHARTRLGVRPSGPAPVCPPEKVAEAILHAAEHGGRDVSVGARPRCSWPRHHGDARVL